jgi:hypothetical protein
MNVALTIIVIVTVMVTGSINLCVHMHIAFFMRESVHMAVSMRAYKHSMPNQLVMSMADGLCN